MPPYSARVVVLRKTKLGESDLILTLLAEDGSQIRAVAKGARKSGSRTSGRVEPAATVDLLLHTGRTLDVIAEVQTVSARRGLREDFDRATAASALLDVLDKVSCEGQAEERVFALAEAALNALEAAQPQAVAALVAAFVIKALAMSGYRPLLSACVACGGAAAQAPAFSAGAGGVLCERCRDMDPAAGLISENARRVAAHLLGATMADIAEQAGGKGGEERATVTECLAVMHLFAAHHLPGRLRALEAYVASVRAGA